MMEDFENLKSIVKEKWLDFYEENLPLFNLIDIDNTSLGQSRYRPDNSTILTIVILLEPKIKDYIQLMAMVEGTQNKIVEILGLNFSPKIAIEERKEEREKNKLIEPPSPLDDFRKQIQESNNQT